MRDNPFLTENSQVTFHSLFINPFDQEGEYVVGRREIGVYINVPAVAIDAVELLEQGKTIQQVEYDLRQKYQTDEIGVQDFVQSCIEMDLVKMVNGVPLKAQGTDNRIHNQFPWITPKFASRFIHRGALIVYGLLTVFWMALYFYSPESLPKIADFLFHDSLTIVVWIGLLSMWGIMFVHEFGHFFAARASNVDASIRFGRKKIYLVIETVIPDIWTLQKRKRIEIYLAGMAFNSVMLSLSLLLVVLNDQNFLSMSEGWYRFCRFVNIINIWSFVTQLLIFTKTDIYYILNDATHCTDLGGNTELLFKKSLGWKLKPEDEKKLDAVSTQERKWMKRYIPCHILGVLFSTGVAIVYCYLSGSYIWYSIQDMQLLSVTSLAFWDKFWSSAYLATPVIWIFIYLVFDFIKQQVIVPRSLVPQPDKKRM